MQLTLRVEDEFLKAIDAAALLGRTRSEHLRIAVEHENQRALEARMTFLSRQLAEQNLVESRVLDGSVGDGLGES